MTESNAAMRDSNLAGDGTIRLVVQEPCLAKYRVPVYRELASRPEIELRLVYGELPDLPNAEPVGFLGELAPIKICHLGRHPVYWHQAQYDYAHPSTTDVLVLQWDVHYASLVPALLRARRNRVPTILWGHGYSKQQGSKKNWGGLRERARNWVSFLADALLFYNHTAATGFQQKEAKAERLFVALNSLDQSPIEAARQAWLATPDRLAEFRQENGLGGVPIVLYVSRLDAANRVDLAIQAVRRLKPVFPQLQLVIVGKGEPEQTRLQDLARDLNVADNVRFLGAIYDEQQLAPWFLSADVFCYPANIGLSLLHAFGYGLPVVTCDRIECQNPEIEALRDGENGRLYKDGDADSLASMLAVVLQNRETRDKMSDAALRTVQTKFSLPNMVDGIVKAAEYCWRQRRL